MHAGAAAARRPGSRPAWSTSCSATGRRVGAPLTQHADVDMVSFTGGLATGQAIIRASAATVKRVAVELGGKNPNVVFADTPVDLAADWAITAVFLHSGQVCSAGARLIVEDSMHDDLVAEIAAARRADPAGQRARPTASSAGRWCRPRSWPRSRTSSPRRRPKARGWSRGGQRPDDPALKDGYFYRPTVFADVTREMRVIREETFGPILTVERFTHRGRGDRAGQRHPLRAGRARCGPATWPVRTGCRPRCGTAPCGSTTYHPYVPGAEWGGMGRSGNGRELGPTGLAEYQEHKHVWHNTAPEPPGWFTGSRARPWDEPQTRPRSVPERVATGRRRHGRVRLQPVARPQHRQVRQLRGRRSATSRS